MVSKRNAAAAGGVAGGGLLLLILIVLGIGTILAGIYTAWLIAGFLVSNVELTYLSETTARLITTVGFFAMFSGATYTHNDS